MWKYRQKKLLAILTNAFNDVFYLLHLEIVWQHDGRNKLVGKAVGTATLDTSKMYVSMMMVILAAAKAILTLTHAIIEFVQQVVLGEQTQGAKYAAAIHFRQPFLNVLQGKRTGLVSQLSPYQNTNGRWLDAMFLQVRLFILVFHIVFLLFPSILCKDSTFAIRLQENARTFAPET